MPSLLQKQSYFDPETGRQFVVAADGFYWKEGKKSPEDSKVTRLMQQHGWQLINGNNVWLVFKRPRKPGELFVIRGEKRWYFDMPNDPVGADVPEGKGLDTLQQALQSGVFDQKAMAMHASPSSTAVNNAGNGHEEVEGNPLLERRVGTARTIMHDDSGAETGLRARPDYGESDSYTVEMNEENSKAGSVLVLSGGVKNASGSKKADMYVSGVVYEPGNSFKLASFKFSPVREKAVVFAHYTAYNLAQQIRAFGVIARTLVAKPAGGLLTTQNIKTQKQPRKELLTQQNIKTQKGESKGFLTGVMHMMPSDLAGFGDVCPCASPECRTMCLNTAGMWANAPAVQNSRKMKTELYFKNRPQFMADMRKSIQALVRKAEKNNLTPAVRINGTSDLPQVAMEMAKEFPDVQFYDYTKIPQPWKRQLPNYHITFSRSEINEKDAIEALQHGVNVAVVFNTPKGKPFPDDWMGYKVLDGDQHDLRFLDKFEGEGDGPFVIGLRGKGKARGQDKGTESGFVVDPNKQKKPELVQIGPAPEIQKPESQIPHTKPPAPAEEEEDSLLNVKEEPMPKKKIKKETSAHELPKNTWFVEAGFDDAHLYV